MTECIALDSFTINANLLLMRDNVITVKNGSATEVAVEEEQYIMTW